MAMASLQSDIELNSFKIFYKTITEVLQNKARVEVSQIQFYPKKTFVSKSLPNLNPSMILVI